MKILELHLVNFGQFNNKKIVLNHNFTLIKGKNESGKTTIFKFIEGMFFGFVKPYLKTLRFNDDYYKYRPWNSDKYEGSIIFEYHNEEYRLYRDFSNKSFKIFDNGSGVEISSELNGFEMSNLSFPGEYFFRCSSDIFSNTILVGQGNNIIDENSSDKISGKISEILSENNMTFSVVDGLKYLERIKNKIGTEKSLKKPLGSLINKENSLKELIRKTEGLKEEYDEYIFKIHNKQKEFFELKDNIKLYDEYLNYNEKERLLKIKKSRDKIVDEINILNNEIGRYSSIEKISGKELSDAEYIIDEIKYIQREFNELSKGKKILFNEFKEYERMVKDENLKMEYRVKILDKYRFKGILTKIGLGLAVLMVSIILIGFIINKFMESLIIFIPAIIAFLTVIGIMVFVDNQQKELIDLFNSKFDKSFIIKDFQVDELDFQNNEILNKYEDISKILKNRDEDIEILLNDEDLKKEELKKLSMTFKNRNGISIEKFIEEKDILKELKKDLEYKKNNLRNIDNAYDLRKLYDLKSFEYRDEFFKLEEFNIENAKRQSDELIKEIASLEEKRNFIELNIIKLPEYIEELESVTEEIKELESYLITIQLAIDEINKASNEVKTNYLPRVMDFLKEYFSNISKYELNLKIDNELNIVFDKADLGEYKNVEDLSKGTIEQIYIGLRIALANEIFNNGEFIIFDDAFNNFDEIRLKNMLYLLKEYSKVRQIVIFTCQDREKTLLSDLQLNEYIEL